MPTSPASISGESRRGAPVPARNPSYNVGIDVGAKRIMWVHTLLAIAGSVVNFVACLGYVRAILKGEAMPNRVTSPQLPSAFALT
jgi:hypothetical protein